MWPIASPFYRPHVILMDASEHVAHDRVVGWLGTFASPITVGGTRKLTIFRVTLRHSLTKTIGKQESDSEFCKAFGINKIGSPMMPFVPADEMEQQLATGPAALSAHGAVAPAIVHDRVDYAGSMIDGRTVIETDGKGRSALEMVELWEFVKTRLPGKQKARKHKVTA